MYKTKRTIKYGDNRRKILVLFLLLLIILCFTLILNITGYTVFPIKKADTQFIQIEKNILRSHINFLTSISPARNYQNIASLNIAADYIENFFNIYCPEVKIQKFPVNNEEYKNLICTFPGKSKQKIIVGAHYDVAGDQAGADDNASGIAGILELAHLLKLNNPNLQNTIEIVAYTLEEPPYFRTPYMGSAIHAKLVHDNKDSIKMMISLEMIGYFSEKPNSQKYPFPIFKLIYPEKADFIAVIGKTGQERIIQQIKRKMIEGSKINTISLVALPIIPGIDFSDHLNYWKYGYNAVMVTDTSFYRNENYHTQKDTISTLNFDNMTEVIKGIYWTIVNL